MTKAVVNSTNRKEEKVKNVFRTIIAYETMVDYKVDRGIGKLSNLEYAQVYAQEGLRMEGEALKVQVLYVICNLQYWRGDEARRCKKVLREFGGGR